MRVSAMELFERRRQRHPTTIAALSPFRRAFRLLASARRANEVLGTPAGFDPPELSAITVRKTPWIPCGSQTLGPPHHALVRDEQLRPMASAVNVEKGHVVLFGHTSIVTENPALFAYASALAAGR